MLVVRNTVGYGYRDPMCVVLMPEAEDLTLFLRSGPDRNGLGPHGYVYEDLRVLESTRRLVRDSRTWEIPKMNVSWWSGPLIQSP